MQICFRGVQGHFWPWPRDFWPKVAKSGQKWPKVALHFFIVSLAWKCDTTNFNLLLRKRCLKKAKISVRFQGLLFHLISRLIRQKTRICASLGSRMKFKTLCYPVFGRNKNTALPSFWFPIILIAFNASIVCLINKY